MRPAERRARELTERMFALREPWRGRFLELTANLATGGAWNGRGEPIREDVEAWLRGDLRLYRRVRLLLSAWKRP